MSNRGDPKKLNPTRYERDFLSQVWIDRRDLATICGYMDNNGMKPRYLSDVVRFCVENMKTWVIAHGATEVDKTSEASTFLEFRFGVSMTPAGKAKKNYMSNLIMDSGFTPTFEEQTTHRVITPRPINIQEVSEEDIAVLKRKSQEQFQGSEHLADEREKKDSEKLSEEQKAFDYMLGIKNGVDKEAEE